MLAEPEPFVALGLSLLAAQDVLEAMLQEVDAAALCQLKAVSAAWCTHARRELCTRLSLLFSRRCGEARTWRGAGSWDSCVGQLLDSRAV